MKARKVRQAAPARKDLKLVYVPVEKLRLWDKNPRENDEAAELLCEMLDSHGFINPIIATRDNIVRAGNTRLKSARLKGMSEVPVVYVDFDSEFDAEMYSIADNKTHEFARWKKGLLAALLQQRKELTRPEVSRRSGFTPLEIENMRIVSAGEEDAYGLGPLDDPYDEKMGPLFTYVGGKSHDARWILSYAPPHDIFVVVFCGALNVYFAKRPARAEIFNDLDGDMINFYRVVRSKKLFPELKRLVDLTLHSRKEWRDARASLKEGRGIDGEGRVANAHAFYVMMGQAFGGNPSAWRHALGKLSIATDGWTRGRQRLALAHERFQGSQIECLDFRSMLEKYREPGTLLYLDPPYVTATRVAPKAYKKEMTDDDHKDLIRLLLDYPQMALLSGYEHPIYAPLEKAGWLVRKKVRSSYQRAHTRALNARGPRARFGQHVKTEVLWINPAAQTALEAAQRAGRRARRVRR